MIIKEKEIKLSINASDGERVIKEINKLKTINEFNIEKNRGLKIHDAYFDNKSFVLAKNGGYLRFRGKLDGHRITLREQKKDKKNILIDESTYPLDDVGIKQVLNALIKEHNINTEPDIISPSYSEIFQSVGFYDVLRVVLDRKEKDVYLEDIKICKMKIDKFMYLSPNKLGPFYEIELDSYRKAFHKNKENFISILLGKYKKVMQVSKLSKYARGINLSYGSSYS